MSPDSNMPETSPATALRVRVIPVILFYNYQIVKSRAFDDYRTIGNLEQTIAVFNQREVDELVILDIGASKSQSGVNTDVLRALSRDSIMPLAFGGGIATLQDIQDCLSAGCDKVVINTACLHDHAFIGQAARAFGSQCIVASVDLTGRGSDCAVYSHAVEDSIPSLTPRAYIDTLIDAGCGELVLTSVDADGKMNGYDLDMFHAFGAGRDIPVLINGGCGHPEHMVAAWKAGASGLCAGSIFYYSEFGLRDIKKYMSEADVPVRRG